MTENTTFENVKFPPGRIVATPGALSALEESGQQPAEFLARHLSGDWGDIHPDDTGLNEDSLKHGGRIMSVYQTSKGERLWLITESDRSSTCILLPEDY